MKEFLYILFCVVILGLGIILLNSKGGDDLFVSNYPVYVSPGVDFSKMDHVKSTYTTPKRSQTVSRSLVGSDLNKKPVARNNSVFPSSDVNIGHPTTSPYSGGLFDNHKNTGNNSGTANAGNIASSMPLMRSANGNTASGNQNGSGLIAGGSGASVNTFRAFVPLNPVNDYREGDIVHPGGNPVEEDQLVSVPVGDGMLPFLFMGIFYTLFLLFKRKGFKAKLVS